MGSLLSGATARTSQSEPIGQWKAEHEPTPRRTRRLRLVSAQPGDPCEVCDGSLDPPGGTILETAHWVVDHCVGPLPVGTLIVKPGRHCTAVVDLTESEAAELGPLLRQVAALVHQLANPDQVYVCLWSHAGWQRGHIHFVIQPAWNAQGTRYPHPGPTMQAAMFEANGELDRAAAAAFAARARELASRS